MSRFTSCAVAVAALLAVSQASAFDVATGNDNVGTDNLLRNACGFADATGTGTTVQGCLNSGTEAVFVSSLDSGGAESLAISGGQATVTGTNLTPFSAFSVSFVTASSLISKAVVNIDASASGFVRFSDGVNTSGIFSLGGNGANFFTVTGDAFDTLSVRTYSDAAGLNETDLIDSLAQIRLGVGVATAVPEPESYALMAGGLAILGFLGRRRRPK